MKNLNNYILEKLHVGTHLRRKKPTKKLSNDDLIEEIIVVCNQIYRKFMIQTYDMSYYNKYDHPIEKRDAEDMWYFKILVEDVYNEGDDIFEYLKDSLEDVLDVEENITYNPDYSGCLHGREYKIFLYNPEHNEKDK